MITYHRTAFYANGTPRHTLGHTLGLKRVIHPSVVKWKGTFCQTLFSIAIGIYTSISAMGQLEKLILTLVIGTRITNRRDTQLGVLDSVVFGAALTKGTAVRANDGRVSYKYGVRN